MSKLLAQHSHFDLSTSAILAEKPGAPRRSASSLSPTGVLLLTLAQQIASAEEPSILPIRYEEDWSSQCAESSETNKKNPIKCISLDNGSAQVSLGGEIRERAEWVSNPVFGFAGVGKESILLQRLLVHGDLKWRDSRLFLQMGSHAATKRRFGRQPYDVNGLDVQQGFVDLRYSISENTAGTLRVGRQEVNFGAGRFFSIREGTNVRQSFDGLRAIAETPDYRVDAFALRPVTVARGRFNDVRDSNTATWGVYASNIAAASQRLDLYYFGYRQRQAKFSLGERSEIRHTLGIRASGQRGEFSWDNEAAYQFGSFGSSRIAAWAVWSDIGYTVSNFSGRPRIGLKADIASGSLARPDGPLGTFNAMFPRLPLFTEAIVVAPANIIHLQPSISLDPDSRLNIIFGCDFIWKHRKEDGFYSPALQPIPGTINQQRYLGYQTFLMMTWRATAGTTLNASVVRFAASDALRIAGGRSGSFVTLSAVYKF